MPKICCSKFYLAVFTISISGFHHGYHTSAINLPSDVFLQWIKEIKTEELGDTERAEDKAMVVWSIALAMFSVGGIVGACLIHYFSQTFGRKKSLFCNNFIILISILFFSISKRFNFLEMFVIGRFLAGVNAGLSAGICQLYLTEIAPDEIRGAIGSIYQLVINIFIVLAQITGAIWGNKKDLEYIFLVAIIPAIVQLVGLPCCPESPKYLLITKDDEEKTEAALSWYRGTKDVSQEMDLLKEEDSLVKRMHTVVFQKAAEKSPSHLLVICAVLSMGQQLCGINSIIYFSTDTFGRGKIVKSPTLFAITTITLAIINAASTLISIFLVDRIGRKRLLLISFFGMGASTVLFSFTLMTEENSEVKPFFLFLSIAVFLGFYSCGTGPIIRFATAELFNHTSKSSAVALSVGFNWFSNFIVVITFPPLQNAIGYHSFLVFVVLDVFFFFYTTLYFPEVKKLSAKEIIELYH